MDGALFFEVNNLFNHYQGTITSTDKFIRIENKNLLYDQRDDKYKCVPCHVEVGLCSEGAVFPFYSDAVEKTCSIIGGEGRPCETIDEVIKIATHQLKRYNFQEKSVCYEQLSLF